MMARRKKLGVAQEELDESTYDIDLSPMLSLMVTLIPIMLLSTAFIKVRVIESALPQVVEKAIQEDRKKKDRDISIQLHMNNNKSFSLDLLVDSRRVNSVKIAQKGNDWDLNKLHQSFIQYKLQYPKVFRVDLYPSDQVGYEEIVKVMDEARSSKSGESKFYILDKESNKKVETDVMFPDVVFSNVVEG